jgi:HEAT repeat protein
MKRLVLLICVLALAGCGATNRPGGDDKEAIMEGQPASYWVQQLKNPDPQIRATALRLLVQHGKDDNSVWNEIKHALDGKDPELQVGACEVFGEMGWDAKDAFEALKAHLNDNNTRVGMAAGIAMARIDPDRAAQAGIPRSILKQKP